MTPKQIRKKWPATLPCSCDRCVSYCQRPGWFLPDEIRSLAAHLGLTVKELFDQYLVVDWWGGTGKEGIPEGTDIGILSPGKPHEHGQLASLGFGVHPADCIFLKEGKCSIHAVKPQECRNARHDVEPAKGQHVAIAKAWQREEGRELLREVGFDPDSIGLKEPNLLEVLDFLTNNIQISLKRLGVRDAD